MARFPASLTARNWTQCAAPATTTIVALSIRLADHLKRSHGLG